MRFESSPRKNPRLSQVFLTTDAPCKKAADALKEWGVKHTLEIGPGDGILTFCILEAGIKVTAVERDERFAARILEAYEKKKQSHWGELVVIPTDIREFDLADWLETQAEKGQLAVVGNIPYGITTPILLWLFPFLHLLQGAILLVQREFADRLASGSGSKTYGSISVYAGLRSEVKTLMKVGRGSFTPQPDVDSSLISLRPRNLHWNPEQLAKVEVVTRMAFQQRRKKLSNAVKAFLGEKKATDSPVDLGLRAEALAPEEFVSLTKFLFPELFA